MSAESIAKLQKFVDGFAMDVGRVRAALDDEKTPAAAKALLVGGLNYVLDTFDMFPDHYKGLGMADDAIVLRLAAAQAVAAGAANRGLQSLSAEAGTARTIVAVLADPLERLVAALPAKEIRGKTAAQILGSADVRAIFDADLNRALKKHEGGTIEVTPVGPEAVVDELRKMMRAALKRAGFMT